MKVLPIAAIPHKYNAFRSIMDLSFWLSPIPNGRVPLVNKNRDKTASGREMDQIGHVIMRLIHTFSEAP